jgi:lipoate-protein ligase A
VNIYFNDSFLAAEENMHFDKELLFKAEDLAASAEDIPVYVRAYEWTVPAITFSEKQKLPADLKKHENSTRFTGGGILFHCPGDIIFSVVTSLKNKKFPEKIKDKAWSISGKVEAFLASCSIDVCKKENKALTKEREYCATYYSPYELYLGEQKVVGIALRKYRKCLLVQGIIHCSSAWDYFGADKEKYEKYFSKGIGLSKNISVDKLKNFFFF